MRGEYNKIPVCAYSIDEVHSKRIGAAAFISEEDCAKTLNLQVSHISEVLSGKRRQHKGFIFRRFDEVCPGDHIFKCCICGATVIGYGNNPEPYTSEGLCCDDCNDSIVFPERLAELSKYTQIARRENHE